MIIPKLYGRLGNQCFQISAAIAHAIKMRTAWAIPRVTNDMRYWPNYFARVVPMKNLTMYTAKHRHNERENQEYEPLPLLDDLVINGYFQSEKYFDQHECKHEIGNALGFHNKGGNYIAIHVRRGDYVSDFSDKWPPLPMEYYTKAMNYFINEKGATAFRIYTDDINFILNFFFKEVQFDGAPYITVSKHRDALTDMRDMYNAAGFIIANSTFSLFPALLRLDQPVTIAPAENRWYGPGNAHLSTKNLMPERFIKI